MKGKDQGPSPLREVATSPPQADHVLVVLFFIRGRPGGCVKAPQHLADQRLRAIIATASSMADPGDCVKAPRQGIAR